MKKRMLSIFLALILIVSNLSSTTAFGAEGSAAGENIILNGGQYLTNSAADPVTNTGIPAGFGTAASAGRIWTDKSVIANNDGSFGITLSTLAQEYMSTTSGTGVGGSGNANTLAADVTFILDMSTSMNTQDVNKGDGTNGSYYRVEAMTKAANDAIRIVMNANPNNRVAVHWFGGLVNSSHVGTLMDMGSYTLTSGTDYLNFTKSGSTYTVKTSSSLKKNGSTYSSVSQNLLGGTPTQDGIMYGVSKTIAGMGTRASNEPKRKPYIFVLSDGTAIQGHKDWYTVPSSSSTPGSYTRSVNNANNLPQSDPSKYDNDGSSDITSVTILTGMFMKKELDKAYYTYNGNDETITSKFYTVGLGSDEAINGTGTSQVFAWAGLDPASVYANRNNQSYRNKVAYDTHNAITTYATGSRSSYASDYIYSNYYKWANDYDKLNEAFAELSNDVEATTTILPLLSLPMETNLDGTETTDIESAISFIDEIGEGFTLDISTLKIGAVTAQPDSSLSISNGQAYQFPGYQSKVVVKTVNGITSLYWYIDADDMQPHIYRFTNRTTPVAGVYTPPTDGIFKLNYNVTPAITTTPDKVTKYTYLTNAITYNTGNTEAKTAAYFKPGTDNPYYTESTKKVTPKSNGIGAAYVSQESLSDGLLTMKLGNNGKLDLVMGIVKSGPETVSTGEDFEYTVTLYNYTNEDRTNLTVTSDGQTQTGINVPAHEYTELIFPVIALDTEQTLTSDSATVSSIGLISNTVDTEVTALPLYTVKFDSMGGSTVDDEKVRSGSAVPEPIDPEWSGHIFQGWYKDETCTTPWNFSSDKITKDDTILYAKWNTVPVAQDDTAATPYETAVTGKVKATDEDLSDTLLYEITTSPAHGTVTVDTDGNWNYTPTDGYHGEDQFTVTIKDQRGGEVTSAITVTVEKPVYTVTFNSKGGDMVADYDKVVSGNTIVKPEDPGRPGHIFEGWYKDDTYGIPWNFNTDTVTGNTTLFAKWNAIPVAQDDTVTTPNGKTVTGTVKVTDIDLDELSYGITADSQYGTVTMDEDGNWTYTPGENFDGEDQFTVTIKDGRGGEATSIIKVTVEKPVYAVAFDSQGGAAVAGYDKITSGNTIVKPGNPDWQGHIFKGWYKDAAGMVPWDFNTDTVTSNITLYAKWNTIPVAQDDTVATPYETKIMGAVKVVDADSSDTLTYEITANPAHGTATVDTYGNWSYTPKDGYHGEDQFTITIDDGQGGSTASTINVTVKKPVYAVIFDSQGGSTVAGYDKVDSGSIISQPSKMRPSWLGRIFEGWFRDAAATLPWTFGTDTVTGNTTLYAKWNTIPTVNSPSVTTPYETAAVITVVGNDADGDSLTYDLKTPPAHGSVTKNSDGNFTYTPEEGYDGPDSFSVIVADGRDGTAVSNITITVEPKKVIPPDYNVTFDSMGGSSIDGYKVTEGVTINEPTAPDKPGFLFEGWYRDNAYSEKWNFNTDTVTGDTILYAKWEENTPLSVDSPSVTTPYGEEKTGNVTVTNPGTGTLTYEKGKEPDHGSATVNPDGSWSYKPADGFSGEDSFTVIVKDENGKEAASTITVTVEAKKGEPSKEPEPPTIIPEIPTTAPETPSPAPETPTTPEPPTTPEVPSIVPTPAPTATPAPVNNKPAVSGSSHDTNYETPVSGQVSGQDADGDSLTYSLGSNPGNGTVTVNSDGSWTYTPNNGFTGNDSFTVKVEDGHGGSGTATIQIHVVRKLGIQLSASPDTIVADGKSTSTLTATVTDSNNVPVAGVRVVFSAEKGSFPNGASAVTDAGGKASAAFKSEKIESVESHRIPVTATVNDSSKGLYAQGQIIITFEPASIKGTVIDNKTGTPVEGATVTVQKDFDNDGVVDFSSKATTSKDGTYRIPVPKGDITYEVLIETPRTINGKDQNVTFVQNSKAGNITGAANETFDSVKTAAGIILLKNSDGTESFLKDYSNYTIEILEKDKSGNQNSVVLDGGIYNAGAEKGTFRMEDLEKGKNYTFNIVYHFENGQSIIVGSVDVELDDDGQINISSVLIDPYGEITDSKTGKPIDGVKVTLYYADTERNSKAGRKAGEMVNLPAVTDFPPADNENPQSSDIYGKYAWMVFPDADYYIVAEKDGYAQFISDTISVGQEIVKYNFQMKNLKDAGTNSDSGLDSQVTSIPKTGENLNLVYGLLLFTICFVFAAIRSQRRKAN